jgi:hypothetical protein
MIDCTQYRRSVLADPHDPDAGLREHRESCRECNRYTEQLLRFESRFDLALRVHVPPQRSSPSAPRAPAYRKGWLAMAASVLLAAVVAGGLWLAAPGSSLAADVVTHMGGEPDAWRRTDVPVPPPDLQAVLGDSKLRLAAGAGMVSYASSCAFRGHRVPHLVIQTASGPVTVMVLVHERVPKSVQFDEQGYRGVIVPVAGHGSVAVLTRGPATDIATVEQIAARVLSSIEWTG